MHPTFDSSRRICDISADPDKYTTTTPIRHSLLKCSYAVEEKTILH